MALAICPLLSEVKARLLANDNPLDKTTVPLAFGKLIVRAIVGSVMEKVVYILLLVDPSKLSGLPPSISPVTVTPSVEASPSVTLPLRVVLPSISASWVTFKPPMTLVSTPVAPMFTPPAPCSVNAPAVVVTFEAPVASKLKVEPSIVRLPFKSVALATCRPFVLLSCT